MTGSTISRRKALAGILASVGTATGGIVLTSDKVAASAEITQGEFALPDKTYTLIDESLADVRVVADVSYDWQSNVEVSAVELSMSVGFSPESAAVIATHNNEDVQTTSQDTTQTLEASVLDAPDLDTDLFTPPTTETTVGFVVILELILFRNGSPLATDRLQQSVDVTIKDEEIQLSGNMTADGSVVVTSE
jgi:hypothetical protein